MDITQTQSTASVTSSNGGTAASSVASDALSSDFETFLKMLTVQMQNQDPLNPVDSSDFATQLAQFSAVEQQVQTNDLLRGLSSQMGALGLGQLQGWVGMDARAEMPVAFDGAPVALRYDTATGADLAQLVVRDAAGAIVHQQSVPTDATSMTWDGLDDAGYPIPYGTYTLSVDSFQGDDLLGSAPVEAQARIVEARMRDGETILILQGGQEIAASDVLALRQPDGVGV